MFYEVLLPQIVGGPVEKAVDFVGSGHNETLQRAGTCYYRCILTCLRYLLKSDGLSKNQQKQLFYVLRL